MARPAGKPIMAYSTDTSVATRGVYLMSFTPQNTVDRIVQHAAQMGKRSYAAFVPDSAFGQVVQGAFQEAVSRSGGRVVAIEKFPLDPAGVTAAAARLSGIAGQIDAIFVPDPYDGAALRALSAANVDIRRVQVLGVGPWVGNRAAAQAAPTALYAAPDEAGFQNFAGRYRARFGQDPARIASLTYDSVSLVAALVRHAGHAALLGDCADQFLRLQRCRRPVPLPRRWLAAAWPCRHPGRRPGRQSGAADLWRGAPDPSVREPIIPGKAGPRAGFSVSGEKAAPLRPPPP